MRTVEHVTLVFFVLCVLGSLSGCGQTDERYSIVPVAGVVTCQGRPIADAFVNFTPVPDPSRPQGLPGRVALGRTDKEGRFRLTTYQNDDGAIIGKHVVTVGLDTGEDMSTPAARRFACRDSKKEVVVEQAISDLKIDF